MATWGHSADRLEKLSEVPVRRISILIYAEAVELFLFHLAQWPGDEEEGIKVMDDLLHHRLNFALGGMSLTFWNGVSHWIIF